MCKIPYFPGFLLLSALKNKSLLETKFILSKASKMLMGFLNFLKI